MTDEISLVSTVIS